MEKSEYDALEALRNDDKKFFEQHPDREYRLRRARLCEVTGPVPKGFAVFSILHRHDVDNFWRHSHFPERVVFSMDKTDDEIRDLLSVLPND